MCMKYFQASRFYYHYILRTETPVIIVVEHNHFINTVDQLHISELQKVRSRGYISNKTE